MDAIRDYIDRMFQPLPASVEVERAKRDLRELSEDKYQRLREDGANENEAVGRVISEFGDFDALIEELGLNPQSATASQDRRVHFNGADVAAFLRLQRHCSWLIGGGLFLIFLGLAAFFAVNVEGEINLSISASETGAQFDFGTSAFSPFGLIALFVGLGAGVALIIIGNVRMNVFKDARERGIRLDKPLYADVQQQRRWTTTSFALGLACGVLLIITGVGLTAIMATAGHPMPTWSVIGAALGVPIIVISTMRRTALDRLLGQGAGSAENLAIDERANSIGGIYWTVTAALYLGLSLVFNIWQYTLIIWPVAGLLFAALVQVLGYRDAKAAKQAR